MHLDRKWIYEGRLVYTIKETRLAENGKNSRWSPAAFEKNRFLTDNPIIR